MLSRPTAAPPQEITPNNTAALSFDEARKSEVLIRSYDASGRRVGMLVQQHFAPGRHLATWQADDDTGRLVAPGVYFCRLVSGAEVDQKQVVIAQ